MLTWYERWHTVLDTSDPPFWKWFVGGKINASFNCVDRHLAKHRNKAAIIFVPEPEDEEPVALTYQELFARVNEFAALAARLRQASRPATASRFTCPWSPSSPITMLACARLGVIHSVVFGGFSGEACGLRAADSGSSRAHLHGRLLPQRQDDRPQGRRPRSPSRPRRRKARRSTRSWSGNGTPGKYASRDADGGRARFLRGRGPEGLSRRARRAGSDGRRSARSS